MTAMDPAELDPIKSALQNQGAVIGRHEQLLHDMMQQLTLLVLSKEEAQVLPPHREFDCTINLLPGATPPRSQLFTLSPPEQAAMEDYIHEALEQGFIRPSSSPTEAGFFFIGKKDGGLNAITIKDCHQSVPP
ncbi:hypothetical protein MHYP_G00111320 [Metynnis hypsauchen]